MTGRWGVLVAVEACRFGIKADSVLSLRMVLAQVSIGIVAVHILSLYTKFALFGRARLMALWQQRSVFGPIAIDCCAKWTVSPET